MSYVTEFWDGVHARGSVVHLGATPAQHYADYFSKAGPFAQDLAAADDVLDVGPGHMHFLASLKSQGRRAIDVSSVARNKIREAGALAYAPGEIEARVVDLATCLSVIQHCEEDAVEALFEDVARALRKAGRFYLNGIHGGHHTPGPQALLNAGRCSHSVERMREIAVAHGLRVHGEHSYNVGALGVWILCLEKVGPV